MWRSPAEFSARTAAFVSARSPRHVHFLNPTAPSLGPRFTRSTRLQNTANSALGSLIRNRTMVTMTRSEMTMQSRPSPPSGLAFLAGGTAGILASNGPNLPKNNKSFPATRPSLRHRRRAAATLKGPRQQSATSSVHRQGPETSTTPGLSRKYNCRPDGFKVAHVAKEIRLETTPRHSVSLPCPPSKPLEKQSFCTRIRRHPI